MTRPRLSGIVAAAVAAGLVASCSGTAAPAHSNPATAAPPAAAASPAAARWPSSVPDAWLVVGRPGQRDLDVIDAATAERFMPLPLGVPDASWGVFVETITLGDRTTVSRLDIAK